MQKANGKEIFSASLVLLIGIIYLAAQAGSLFSIGSTTVKGDTIQLSKNELFSHVRSLLTILLCLSGGIFLLKIKRTGWIISQAILLLLLTITCGILFSNLGEIKSSLLFLTGGILLLLTAFIFLLQRQTRKKFMIGRKSYFAVAIVFGILVGFYFFLQ